MDLCGVELLLSALAGIATWELARTVQHVLLHQRDARQQMVSRDALLTVFTRLERLVRGQ